MRIICPLLILVGSLSGFASAASVSRGITSYAANVYVDSQGGDDASDGLTPGTAWRTLQHVQASAASFSAWTDIHLKRGSVWTGASAFLDIDLAYVRIEDYGTGSLPVIDGRVAIPASAWTPVAGYPSVYQTDRLGLVEQAEQHNVWADGARLSRAADLAGCAATPGSYWVPPESAWHLGAPSAIYLHAAGDSDPRSDGRTYLTQGVAYVIALGLDTDPGAVLRNVDVTGGCHHNGNVRLGRDSMADGVVVRWGTIHALYIDSGLCVGCLSLDDEQGFDFVANKGSASDGEIEMVDCSCDVDATSGTIPGPGFFVHGTTMATVRFTGCRCRRHDIGFAVDGIGQDGQSIAFTGCSATCPSDGSQFHAFDINTGDFGGTYASSVSVVDCLADGHGFFLCGLSLNSATAIVIDRARAIVRGSANPAIQIRGGAGLEVAHSSFYSPDGCYSGIEMTVDGTSCYSHHNIFDHMAAAGATEQFNATQWRASDNIYFRSSQWRVAGAYFIDFAAYQAAVAPQDADSLVADPQWMTAPDIAYDFSIRSDSPAALLGAGYPGGYGAAVGSGTTSGSGNGATTASSGGASATGGATASGSPPASSAVDQRGGGCGLAGLGATIVGLALLWCGRRLGRHAA